jgi:hypothetical protein
MVFGPSQVLVSAAVGSVVSLVVIYVTARFWSREPVEVPGAFAVSLLVGFSILVWRLVANTPQLNDDLVPVVSPNDVLCPVITYVVLGTYAGVRGRPESSSAQRERALLTIVSLVVNIITI